jgi:ribonuclease E
MLIDARHREETRVAVVKGNRIEEFDFESAERKQLKGNIYLAKVTRVEPSLQAAFVDYGGNRHGFLAFSEIHPDYYQIPKEDREALLREEAEHAAEEARLREAEEDFDHDDDHDEDHELPESESDADDADDQGDDREESDEREGGHEDNGASALRAKRMSLRRRYKIQDVIHRRQVLLVQVVKEERGNKGAALTTYLSLAGRYCVLMPNTTHGGGISRKISNGADRKRLKAIMADLALPSTMGCIVRTAGLQRTKTEIKRDFDYLARVWDDIRDTTLGSTAPTLIHQDSDLIKRAIRDIYNKDIDEVMVEGEDGYRHARDFMKLLMPSHAKKVKAYADAVPLYQRYGVEDQLAAMYNPVVQLKSGGYLVINPTEALVSIDINSGRSTREHGIEATAVSTNLEAAKEIARQLRLRDMAGLVVIDFIDMESNGNIRKVEKAMKGALADDRARIQVGRISQFGLLEMSRQRLRTGVLEASTRTCPHCEGTGLVRTASSAGLSALRMLEEEAARGHGSRLTLRASQEAAFYVLNRKRTELGEIEARYGVMIEIVSDGQLEGARMTVESSGPPPEFRPQYEVIVDDDPDVDDDIDDVVDEEEDEEEEERSRDDSPRGRNRSRRRRGRRGRRDESEVGEGAAEGESPEVGEVGEVDEVDDSDDAGEGEARDAEGEGDGERDGRGRRRRRRGRRGGRGRRPEGEGENEGRAVGEASEQDPAAAAADSEAAPAIETEDAPAPRKGRTRKAKVAEPAADLDAAPEAPAPEAAAEKPKRTRRKKADDAPVADAEPAPAPAPEPAPAPAPAAEAPAAEKPKRTRKKAVPAAAAADPELAIAGAAPSGDDGVGEDGEPRRGWWQRTFGPES